MEVDQVANCIIFLHCQEHSRTLNYLVENTVWYVDGNVSYFSKKHYILMEAAAMFLLLADPYTLALLFDAVIEKYLTKIMFFRRQWIKFKPFVDAYHGPYKDNCRFWTGLLLLVRMSFTLVSLHLDTFGTLIFITTTTTVLLSLLVTFEGVYQKKYLNILECSSFLNLGLLSALVAVFQNDEKSEQVVTIISVSIALSTFTGVLFFHIFLHFHHNFIKCCNKNKESERLLEDEENVERAILTLMIVTTCSLFSSFWNTATRADSKPRIRKDEHSKMFKYFF